MLQADMIRFNENEYIIIDTAEITLEQKGLAKLANYRQGVGAERILLVDKKESLLVTAIDKQGRYDCLTMSDYRVAGVILGKVAIDDYMHHMELRITESFLQKILAPKKDMKIAS